MIPALNNFVHAARTNNYLRSMACQYKLSAFSAVEKAFSAVEKGIVWSLNPSGSQIIQGPDLSEVGLSEVGMSLPSISLQPSDLARDCEKQKEPKMFHQKQDLNNHSEKNIKLACFEAKASFERFRLSFMTKPT